MQMSEIYRANCESVRLLVERVPSAEFERLAPACPQWTCHEVLAHVSGASSDFVTGRIEGLATPEWTGRQVAERQAAGVVDLVNELLDNVDAVAPMCDRPGPNAAWDLCVHVGDLNEALNLDDPVAETGWEVILEAARASQRDRGTHPVPAASEQPGAEVQVQSLHEFFRGVFGRRTEAEIRENVLAGDVEAVLARGFFPVKAGPQRSEGLAPAAQPSH